MNKLFLYLICFAFFLPNVYAQKVTKLWDISLKKKDINLKEWKFSKSVQITNDGILTQSSKENSEAVLLKDIEIPKLSSGKILRIEWEYTPLRIGKYGQDFRIENGPLVMEVMSRRPFLNVSGRASFDQTNNRRYKVTCDFFQDYVLSWKINGMEQLKEPITCWKKSTKKPQITLADFPTSVSRTLWHRIALYQIDQIDQLKINLLCLKQIQRNLKADFLVGINNSMDKIPLDKLSYKGEISDTVEVFAAGNERVSFQLAVIPQNKNVEQVKISISDFLSKNNKRLPSNIASSNLVGYVKLLDSKITESKYGQYYPDAILPLKAITVNKDLTQPYWFTIAVPAGTAPGVYESIINISTKNNGQKSLKLKLNVRNFNLPLRNSIVTALAINPGCIERCYNSKKSRQIFGNSDALAHDKMYNLSSFGPLEGNKFWRQVYDMLLSYRVNPASIYSDILAGGEDFRVVPAMEDMDYCYKNGLNAACLMCLRKLPKDVVKRKEYFAKIKKHLSKWETFVKKRNWPNFVWYIHAFDESEIHANTPELRKQSDKDIKELTSFIKKHFPWIKIETANPYVERNKECFDIWTPKTFRMDEYTKTKANFWVYICCGPQKPYANFFIDYPGTDPRVLPWQFFRSKTKIQGFLYYLMNRNILPFQWAKVKEPFPFVPVRTRWLNTNGDGLLIYPGPDKKVYPSTRLAAFRDGLQDYEAFKLLQQLSSKLKSLPNSSTKDELLNKAAKLLSFSDSPVISWTQYSSNPVDYTNYRKQVDLVIEKIISFINKK